MGPFPSVDSFVNASGNSAEMAMTSGVLALLCSLFLIAGNLLSDIMFLMMSA